MKSCTLKPLMVFCFILVASLSWSQNLISDVLGNNLDGLKKKVELLSPSFKVAPYLADYLGQCRQYDPQMFAYLIEKGADPNQKDSSGMSPLYWAVRRHLQDAFDGLLAHKADVNARWASDAAKVRYFPGINAFFLGQQGPKDRYTATPLLMALHEGQPLMVRALLDQGADPLATVMVYQDGKPAKGVTKTVWDSVLDYFASQANLRSDGPVIPYGYYASAVEIYAAVRTLPAKLQPKIDRVKNANRFFQILSGDQDGIKAALVSASTNTVAEIPYAVLAGSWDIAQLIAKYNDIPLTSAFVPDNTNGWAHDSVTLAAWAVTGEFYNALKTLEAHAIPLPAEVVFYGTDNTRIALSPLAFALVFQRLPLLKYLLDHKADPNSPDQPLRYAHAVPAMRELLISAGANINALYKDPDSNVEYDLLFDAVHNRDLEGANFYLAQGISPSRSAEALPLIAASVNVDLPMVKLMIDHGVDINPVIKNQALYGLQNSENKSLFNFLNEWGGPRNTAEDVNNFQDLLKLLQTAPAPASAP